MNCSASWCARRRMRGQAQMREDLRYHGGYFDRGDDLQLTPKLGESSMLKIRL
jgi:hypothetical protein